MTRHVTTVKENRKAFLNALRATDPALQCHGQMFAPGTPAPRCAEGVAVEIFLGIDNMHDYSDYRDRPRSDPYTEIAELLGLENGDEIYNLNDSVRLTFAEIADLLSVKWGV